MGDRALANGDVVACEVHDRQPLGNVARQPLAEIWQGEIYERFRVAFRDGTLAECRTCPWKRVPGPLRSEILGARGRSSQMGYRWHESAGEPHLWVSQQAVATLQPRPGSSVLHVHGTLPPGPDGFNRLEVRCNGTYSREVVNRDHQMLEFGEDLRMPLGAREPWEIEFRTEYVHHAADDQRDLGFALTMAASLPPIDPWRCGGNAPHLARFL